MDLINAAQAVLNNFDGVVRDGSHADQGSLKYLAGNIDKLRDAVNATPLPRTVAPPSFTGGTLASAHSPHWGFTTPQGSFDASGFLGALRLATRGTPDPRLMNAVTTYGSEGVGPDGGWIVAPAIQTMVESAISGEESLLSTFVPTKISTNALKIPVDETTPHGASGVIAEWLTEGGAYTHRKPALKETTIQLYKVGALVYMTDELLQDSPGAAPHLFERMTTALTAKVNEALVAGTGTGQPLGFLSAPAKVTVAKEGSQAASTVLPANLTKMISRLAPGEYGRAVWVTHSSALPAIWGLTFGSSSVPLMQPDFRRSPYGELLGRPLVVSEFSPALSSAGDVALVSPRGFVTVVHAMGPQMVTSIHAAFDQGLQAFRITARVGSAALASGAFARKNGSDTQSHIVELGAR